MHKIADWSTDDYQKVVIELLAYKAPVILFPELVQMSMNMIKASGWSPEKCAAFSVRTIGINIGEIGPDFKPLQNLNQFGLNDNSALAIQTMRLRGSINRFDLIQFEKQYKGYMEVISKYINFE